MTSLNAFHTLHDRVMKYQEENEIEKLGEAFDRVALKIVLNLTDDEIEDAITDGGDDVGADDGGIDAIHIDGTDVHVFSFTYTDNFEKTKNNFPANKVDKFILTMTGILSRELTPTTVNELIWEKSEAIWNLYSDFGSAVTFYLYFGSNKEPLVKAAQDKLEALKDKFQIAGVYYYNLEEFVTKILENRFTKVNGEIHFVDKSYFDRSDGSLRTIVATISATDLVSLVQRKSDPSQIEESAFDDNCRVYKGRSRNEINSEIYDSALADDNFKFYYLNNGITIVCDSVEYPPNQRHPLATLVNFQIVNGGQTTHALFEAAKVNEEKLNDVLVLARICVTNDQELVKKISETTNNQTPVTTRDLRANDVVQKRLEDQFLQLGYFYERKKSMYATKPRKQRLDAELLAQLYLAFYKGQPAEAKNQKSSLFGDSYAIVFDEQTISASKLLVPYRIYLPLEALKKQIQAKKRKKEEVPPEESFIPHATFHLVDAINLISQQTKLDLENEEDLEIAISLAIKFVGQIVKNEAASLGVDYSHNKFFKNTKSRQTIDEFIKEQFQV